MFYDNIIDNGFSGTAPQFAAHAASIGTALKRVDTAITSRKPGNPQFLHQHVSSVGLGGTNGAPTVNIRWLNEREQPGIPIQLDTFVESAIKNLIATATVTHDGATRTHNVSLSGLAALAW